MWKVCQVLKGGRSHISRTRNANSFSSPAQQSSSTQALHEEHFDSCRHRRPIKRPVTFTPSLFRSLDKKGQNFPLVRASSAAVDDGHHSNGERPSGDNFGNEQAGSTGGRGRPDHEHDGWDCRCRCRFREFVGYTSLVAASIHLCHIINHGPDKDQLELCQLNEDGRRKPRCVTMIAEFKDAFQSSWQQFIFHAAPVLFPDVFKRWYVLPAPRQRSIEFPESSRLENRARDASIEENQQDAAIVLTDSSASSSSATAVSAVSTSTSFVSAVSIQTDSSDIGTPFDNFMLESGRRLAAITRMTDVTLEHAIGVDLLKRRLYDEAIDYLLGAARSGHASALYNVGICYSRGFGVRRDMTKAVQMWRAAADQGHGWAKYQMGVCHARGLGGLAMDHDRALRYMEAAASTGVAEAKTYLAANEYKLGRLEGALDLLRQAMSGGDQEAKELLQEWSTSDSKDQRNSSDGYVFEDLAKVKVALSGQSATIKRIDAGRRRFWASSSSEKEDSISSSSSSSPQRMSDSSRSGSSSVVFCDEDSLECGKSKIASPIEVSGSHAIQTVASLLTLGSLHRSKTAPDFRYYGQP